MHRVSGRAARFALLVGLAAATAACGSGRETVGNLLGMTKGRPDPFNVYPHAPLVIPQDTSTLPPPEPGKPSPLEPKPEAEARAALADAGAPVGTAGKPAPAESQPSAGEQALLASAGAAEANPEIRSELKSDDLNREPEYGFTYFFGYKVPDGSEKDILEAREEQKRLIEEGEAAPNPPPEKKTPSNVLF